MGDRELCCIKTNIVPFQSKEKFSGAWHLKLLNYIIRCVLVPCVQEFSHLSVRNVFISINSLAGCLAKWDSFSLMLLVRWWWLFWFGFFSFFFLCFFNTSYIRPDLVLAEGTCWAATAHPSCTGSSDLFIRHCSLLLLWGGMQCCYWGSSEFLWKTDNLFFSVKSSVLHKAWTWCLNSQTSVELLATCLLYYFSIKMSSSSWWHVIGRGEREKLLILIPSSMQIHLNSFFRKFWILPSLGNNRSVFSNCKIFTLGLYSSGSPSESSQTSWTGTSQWF